MYVFQFVAVVGHVFPDIDVQNEDGDTALHLATEFDQPSVIETLLKHKADFHKVHQDLGHLSGNRNSFFMQQCFSVLKPAGPSGYDPFD